MNLVEVAEEIQHRIIHIFGRDMEGKRATNGGNPKLDHDPHFRDLVWFHEVRLPELYLFRRKLKLRSSSTVTTDEAWEHRIKLAGKEDYPLTAFICSFNPQVWVSGVPYLAKWRDLQAAKDPQKCVDSISYLCHIHLTACSLCSSS